MRNKLNIILLLLAVFSGADQMTFSQATGMNDSLRLLISRQGENRHKADNFIILANAFYDSHELDSAECYYEKALTLSKALTYPEVTAEAIFRKGLIENSRSDFNSALVYFRQYIPLIRQLKDQAGICKGYYNYGLLLKKQGQTDSALYYFHECLKINSVLQDTLKFIAIYNAMGNIFQDAKSQFDSATFYYVKTIKLCNESGHEKLVGKIYDNLGKTFTRLHEYDQADKYLKIALERNHSVHDTRAMVMNLINIGNNFTMQERLDSALNYYNRASELLKPFGEVLEQIDLYLDYAVVYKLQGKYEKALTNYRRVLAYYRVQKQAEGTMITLKNIGDIYKRQNNFSSALVYYDSSLAIARKTGYNQNHLDILYSVFQVYYSLGDYKKAYRSQEEYYTLKDSLFNLNKTQLISELTLKYEKEQDRSHILSLEKDNLKKDLALKQRTIQRNTFIYTFISILIIGGFLFLYLNQRRKKDSIIARQKIQKLEEEKKLLAARALVEGQEEERKRIALELHDGLGVLLSATKMQFTSIRDTSPENLPLIQKATQLLEQASGDVRVISHNMMPGLLMKLGLYEAVEDLFDNLGDNESLSVHCDIREDLHRLPENQEIMMYRIIQEMVNNTLKHAHARNIRLRIGESDGKLELDYSDDGKGFDVHQEMDGKSLGLKSIKSRVDFLNGKLTIESKPLQGTTYSIIIPGT